MVLDGISAHVGGIGEDVKTFIAEKPLATAVIGAGVAGTLAVGAVALVKSRKKSKKKTSKKKKKSKSKKKKKGRKLKFGSKAYRKKYLGKKRKKKIKPKYARTAGKRRDTSTRRIRMTKHGQPYVILASGKARFISKKSAKASRKRKGGRY